MIYFRHFDTVNWWNTIVSIVSIFIIAITPRFSKKIPGSLIAIIVVTVAVWLMKVYGGIDCIDTIGDRFSIRAELPDAVMPALDWEAIKNLFPRSHYNRCTGCHRIFAVCHRGRWCDRRQTRFQHGTDSTRCCQHDYPAVWRYPCHRSHRAYHGKYQQRRKNSRSRHGACSGIAAYPTVPHAAGTVYPNGLPGGCTGHSIL